MSRKRPREDDNLPATNKRQRRSVIQEDDDEDESSQGPSVSSSQEALMAPKMEKKAALLKKKSGTTASLNQKIGEADEDEGSSSSQGSQRLDKYPKGSIVRVKLCNFVTYDHCEFSPGSQFNMIIGPNGTGKSSIVCAIALGLGGKPSILGRAKEIREFVKHGKATGSIEIELARAGSDGRNVTVRRTIENKENKSKWEINDRKTTEDEVRRLIKNLGIQVDNLCQFLPQDRVVEFSKLNSQQLLIETQRAVEPELLDLHNELIQRGKTMKDSSSKLEAQKKHLDTIQNQLESLKSDYEKFLQQQEHRNTMTLIRQKKTWIKFEEQRQRTLKYRDEANKKKKELDDFEKEIQPIQSKLNDVKMRISDTDKKVQKSAIILRRLDGNINDLGKELQILYSSYEDSKSEMDRLRPAIEQRIEKTQRNIAKLEQQLQNFDANIPFDELEDYKTRIHPMSQELSHLKNQSRAVRDEMEIYKRKCERKTNQLRQLNDKQSQMLETVRAKDRNAYNAHQWIKQNEARFKKRVYGPVILDLNISSPVIASAFEQLCPNWLKFGFVCEDEDDVRIIRTELIERQKISIGASYIPPHVHFVYSHSTEELQQYGVQDWLLRLITAPTPVLLVLQENASFNSIAVARDGSNVQRVLDVPFIRRLIANETHYNKITSRYGNRETSISSEALRPSNLILGSQTDEEERRRIETKLNNYKTMYNDRMTRFDEGNELIKAKELQITQLREKIRAIERKVKEKQELMAAIDEEKKSAVRHERELVRCAQREAVIKAEMVEKTKDRIRKSTKLFELNEQLCKEMIAIDFVKLEIMAMRREEIIYEAELATFHERKKALHNEWEEYNRLYQAEAQKTRELKKKADTNAPLTDQLRKDFETLPNTLDELKSQLNALQLKTELASSISANIEAQFKEKESEVKELQHVLAPQEQSFLENKNEIDTLKNKWLVPLKKILQKIDLSFGTYFRNIAISGSVSLAERDTFEEYGIQIKVQFREGGAPQVLDGFTQSGGERSVSTMLYLISLQDYTKCPFRLVDEINQGMDPTNEKLIFEEISRSACKPNQPQLFLVTPKLLPNLQLTPEMTVCCVMNGHYMLPQDDWPKFA